MIIFDRDQSNLHRQSNVFSKMSDIIKEVSPEVKEKPKNQVAFVSVEDALKELLNMGEEVQ